MPCHTARQDAFKNPNRLDPERAEPALLECLGETAPQDRRRPGQPQPRKVISHLVRMATEKVQHERVAAHLAVMVHEQEFFGPALVPALEGLMHFQCADMAQQSTEMPQRRGLLVPVGGRGGVRVLS